MHGVGRRGHRLYGGVSTGQRLYEGVVGGVNCGVNCGVHKSLHVVCSGDVDGDGSVGGLDGVDGGRRPEI